MSTTAIPLLPKLKEEHSISLNASGVWQPQDIANIIRSINIDNSQVAGMEGINSIPNIWARPLLFEMALYDNKHILHNRIVQEWRGLMAMLALREMRGLPLRAVSSNSFVAGKYNPLQKYQLEKPVHSFV